MADLGRSGKTRDPDGGRARRPEELTRNETPDGARPSTAERAADRAAGPRARHFDGNLPEPGDGPSTSTKTAAQNPDLSSLNGKELR